MLEGGLKLNLNRLIRRGFADRRGVVMVLWHTTGSPTGGEHRLIALSEVDTAFDEKAVKELGRAAKLPTGADIARFGENIRIAARLYLEGKSRLNAPRLREKIERLYQLNMRADAIVYRSSRSRSLVSRLISEPFAFGTTHDLCFDRLAIASERSGIGHRGHRKANAVAEMPRGLDATAKAQGSMDFDRDPTQRAASATRGRRWR